MGHKTIFMIITVFCIILANVLPILALEQGIGVKAVIKVGGLQALRDGSMNLIISINNANVSQVIEIFKGKEISMNATMEAQTIKKGSSIIVDGIVNGSNVLKIRLILHEGGWYVAEAEYDPSVFKPIANSQLIQARMITSLARVEIFIPNFLITDEVVEIKLGEETITPSITKSNNGSSIIFNAFINVNETPTINVHVFKENKTLLNIFGRIPLENNFTGIAVEGIFNNVNFKVLRGSGLIEFSVNTTVLNEWPLNDRGVIFKGIEISIKPITGVEANREVRINVLDEFTKKLIEKPVKFSIYTELHKTWLNVTSTSGNFSLLLPKEPIIIYAHVEGYEDNSIKVDSNATKVIIYLKNSNPPPEERLIRSLHQAWDWTVSNWFIFLSLIVLIVVMIIIWRVRE
jgi:hypothetical protein